MSVVIKGLNDVLLFMPVRIKNILYNAMSNNNYSFREIRLRIDKPIVLVCEKGSLFLSASGKLTHILSYDSVKITGEEFNEMFRRICDYSVYSYQDEINKGFITVKGGHRIGICGTAVKEKEKIISVKNINCINIRLANEIIGCADEIVKDSFCNQLSSVVIAGPPNSGKTTVLRDLVRQISNGNAGEYYKCTVIDERGEISGANVDKYTYDIGGNTDVLINYPKSEAIGTAVRTLSPDIVFCDETMSETESKQILEGMMSGINFVITVHCRNIGDLYKKSSVKMLFEKGAFESVYLLGTNVNVGKIKEKVDLGEIYENFRIKSFIGADNCNR